MLGPGGSFGGSFGGSSREMMRWASISQHASSAQMGVGLFVLILSWRYTYEFTEAAGIILGLVMGGVGALGYLGGRRRSGSLTNLHLLGCIVALFLSFSFIAQVVREVEVDCGLSHLFLRGQELERRIAAVRDADALNAVYARMNELEDSMSAAGVAAGHRASLARAQEALREGDTAYVAEKIEMLLRHAQEVQDDALRESGAKSIGDMDKAEKERVVERLRTAHRVIKRIQQHREAKAKAEGGDAAEAAERAKRDAFALHYGHPPAPPRGGGDPNLRPLAFEEYRDLLEALTSGPSMADKASDAELARSKSELVNFGAALGRTEKAEYHLLAADADASDAVAKYETDRAMKRQSWDARFDHATSRLERAYNRAQEQMQTLADHCLRETAGERLAVFAGLLAILVQLAAAFAAVSVGQRVGKAD